MTDQGRAFWIRIGINRLVVGLCSFASIVAVCAPLLILIFLFIKGVGALNLNFFTQPVGSTKGVANAIVGTLELIGLASIVGIPVGVMSGLYLSEFGRSGWFPSVLRFLTDVLNSIPSIVVGVFGFAFIVIPTHGFSALAGAVTLTILMIPIVTRSTEEIAALVPNDLREAGLALGLPYWRVVLSVVIRTARAGIVTGILLSLARISGESAPLLLTTLGNSWWNHNLTQPMDALALRIFLYWQDPRPEMWSQAWACALVLVAIIAITSLLSRWSSSRVMFKR